MTETLGQRIRRLRKGQNLKTCIALSAILDVSIYSVRNWERDASTPHPNNMLDLAKALGVTQRYLAFGVSDIEFPQDMQPIHYDPPRGLPNRLKELRLQRGLSLVKTAKQAGVSHRSLWRWEAGKRKPTTHCLGRLASFYGVSEDFLLHGVEQRREDQRLIDLKAAVLRWTISKRPVADLQRLVSEA